MSVVKWKATFREVLRGIHALSRGHICLDKQSPVWFMRKLINLNRGPDYEKDIDEFQQHEDEANPWFPRPDGHQGGPGGPEQETGEGEKEIDGVTRGRAKGGSGRPRERGGTAWKPKPLATMSAFGKDKTICGSTSRGFGAIRSVSPSSSARIDRESEDWA